MATLPDFQTLQLAQTTLQKALAEVSEEAEVETRWLLDHLGFSSHAVRLQPDTALTAEQQRFLKEALQRRQQHEPLQHILGTQPFRYVELMVNKHVLTPRPETEELVQLVIDHCKTQPDTPLQVADIGTGSGAIAIALKTECPWLQVDATDLHESALTVARQNAHKHRAEIQFFQGHGLQALSQTYDIIVSNPPYIPLSEKESLAPEVRHYEPHAALFPEGNDPLYFYRHFASEARILKPGGAIFLEIHAPLASETLALFQTTHWQKAKLHQDLQHRPRFISARRAVGKEN